jgi:hypothetical protein
MSAVNMSQFLCLTKIEDDFFTSKIPGKPEDICEIVQKVIDRHPNQVIYVGITYHPCGRYTGNYKGTQPLPPKFNISYKFGEVTNEELLLESPHKHFYNKMYVIFSHPDLEKIVKLEKQAIECARNLAQGRVNNGSKGGEGNFPESELYFLYICVSSIVTS